MLISVEDDAGDTLFEFNSGVKIGTEMDDVDDDADGLRSFTSLRSVESRSLRLAMTPFCRKQSAS